MVGIFIIIWVAIESSKSNSQDATFQAPPNSFSQGPPQGRLSRDGDIGDDDDDGDGDSGDPLECPITQSSLCSLIGLHPSSHLCLSLPQSPNWINSQCVVSCNEMLLAFRRGLGRDGTHSLLPRLPNASDTTMSPDSGHDEACSLARELIRYSFNVEHNPGDDALGLRNFYESAGVCMLHHFHCSEA
jgi:hypothetical protein